jgi:hypothetical protein
MFGTVTPEVVQGVTGSLLAAGPIGAVAIVAIAFFWVAWKRERDRADSERAAKDALVRELIDKVLPALLESTRATRDFVDYSRSERR